MKNTKEIIKKIFQEDRNAFWFMVVTLILSVFLFLFAIFALDPEGSVINTGYNDVVGGYRNGAWTSMLTFPLLAILFGAGHSLIGLKIYEKRGGGPVIVFAIITIGLIIGTAVLMIRLLGD